MSITVSRYSKPIGRFVPKVVPLDVVGRVYDDLSDQSKIDKLISSEEKLSKERELIKQQLLLPVDKRSKELFRKYGINLENEGQIDGYPSLGDKITFHFSCFLPFDKTIDDLKRPVERSYKLSLFTDKYKNDYSFYFPISHFAFSPTESCFKIDGMSVFIYSDGSYDPRSEYGIYCALYDNLHSIETNKSKMEDVLKKYGLLNESGLIYAIKGLGIKVEYYLKNSLNKAIDVINEEEKDEPMATIEERSNYENNSKVTDDMLNKLIANENFFDPLPYNALTNVSDDGSEVTSDVVIDTSSGDIVVGDDSNSNAVVEEDVPVEVTEIQSVKNNNKLINFHGNTTEVWNDNVKLYKQKSGSARGYTKVQAFWLKDIQIENGKEVYHVYEILRLPTKPSTAELMQKIKDYNQLVLFKPHNQQISKFMDNLSKELKAFVKKINNYDYAINNNVADQYITVDDTE